MFTNKKGVTLIELIIVVALISIIFGLGFLIYTYGEINYSNETILASNQQNLRFAIMLLAKNVRNAVGPVTVDSASSITINSDTYILEGNKIVKKSDGKSDTVFLEDVGQFNVTKTGDIFSIEIVSTANKMGNTVSLQTEIVVR